MPRLRMVLVLCVAGLLLWMLALRIDIRANLATTSARAPSPAPRDDKKAPRPAPASAAVVVGQTAAARAGVTADALAAVGEATLHLRPEEQAILDRYTADHLDKAIAEAQNALLTASPETVTEADRKYLLTVNLAAKLSPRPPDPSAEMLAHQREYLQQVAVERARLAGLPQQEGEAKLAEFKDGFFKADLEQPPVRTAQ